MHPRYSFKNGPGLVKSLLWVAIICHAQSSSLQSETHRLRFVFLQFVSCAEFGGQPLDQPVTPYSDSSLGLHFENFCISVNDKWKLSGKKNSVVLKNLVVTQYY